MTTMTCRDCEKELKGGFKQEDGAFLCAICTVFIVERQTNKEFLSQIVTKCDAMLVPGLRPTKDGVRLIRSIAIALKRESHAPRAKD